MFASRKRVNQKKYTFHLTELNYSTLCNFKCQHCFAQRASNIKESKLSLTDVKKLASQAHSLGCWQWNLQGGEPLLWTNLEEIIQTINPSRFYFFITTNGWFMTEQRAKQLAQMGVDKICISLDSFNSEEHDTHRGMPGAFDKALAALEYVKKENMVANINFTVTHANIKSPLLKEVISFAQEKGYLITFMIAIPAGKWRNRKDLLLTSEDISFLEQIRKDTGIVQRDIWNSFSKHWGCPAVNAIYVNPSGDVLPCPFIHAKLGNIKKQSLSTILTKGLSIKYFQQYPTNCLAGEDTHFIDTFMSKTGSIDQPVNVDELFSSEDLIEVPSDFPPPIDSIK